MVSYDCCKKSKFLGDTHKNISSQGVYIFIKKKKPRPGLNMMNFNILMDLVLGSERLKRKVYREYLLFCLDAN